MGREHRRGMPVSPAICVPAPDEQISIGKTTIAGYAVAYGRAVTRVDVSTDGGATWKQADLRSEPDELDVEINIDQRPKLNRENVAVPARVLLFRKAIAD